MKEVLRKVLIFDLCLISRTFLIALSPSLSHAASGSKNGRNSSLLAKRMEKEKMEEREK